MDTDAHGWEPDLTEAVIGSAFEIANVLGAGFLEKVYERALIRELALRGVRAKAQVSFPVCYKGQYVGEYMADLVVHRILSSYFLDTTLVYSHHHHDHRVQQASRGDRGEGYWTHGRGERAAVPSGLR